MKATTETLSPTRVKLTVEVPFDELAPSVDRALKTIGRQVKVQGFRPGKVPARLLEQRVGRPYVLDEAVNDAIPRFYDEAVKAEDVKVIGRPDVAITSFTDGEALVFTAEVDVRPDFELPSYDKLPVVVDAIAITDDEVDVQLSTLRDRFATLESASRPVQHGDYVSLDLDATVDGESVDGAQATGLSYEVGSDTLVVGLDAALIGLEEGASTTFQTELVAGDAAGKTSDVAVTVRSVKRKNLPELDDEFATTASEFDTLAELREDIRTRMSRVRAFEQGAQARDKVLDGLLAMTEVSLPESMVEAEYAYRIRSTDYQLEQAGLDKDVWLETEGKTAAEFEAEIRKGAAEAVKTQFILDAIAEKEQLGITEGEVSDQIVRRSARAGVPPQEYMDHVVKNNQVGTLMAEVVRGKALAMVMEGAVITDTSGAPVDLAALNEVGGAAGVVAEALADESGEFEDHEGHDHEGHDHEGHDHEGHDHEGHDHEGHDHG